jgi:hypothetical protein
MPDIRFHHVTVVWGEPFTRFFLRCTLPCMLAKENIPAMSTNRDSVFVIYTTERDATFMKATVGIDTLRRYIRVEFRVIAPEDEPMLKSHSVYNALAAFHRDAIQRAAKEGAFLTIWAPDTFMSAGTFPALERRAAEGYDTVLVSRLLAVEETMNPWFATTFDGRIQVSLSAAHLVEVGWRHFHPLTAAMMFESDEFANDWPSELWWHDGSDVIVAHSWHLHPLMSRPSILAAGMNQTVDGGYLQLLANGGWAPYLCTDSDEICIVGPTTEQYGQRFLRDRGAFNRERVLKWTDNYVDPAHAELFRIPVVFKGSGASQSVVAELTQNSAKVAHELVASLNARTRVPRLWNLDDLSRTDAIHIYGTGAAGRNLLARLRREGFEVTGFIDSFRGGSVDDIPVRRLADYLDVRRVGDQVIIGSQYVREIFETLRAAGVGSARDGSPFSQAFLDFEIRRLDT